MDFKKLGVLFLNYSPGLFILIFSLFALYSSVVLIEENQALHEFYIQNLSLPEASAEHVFEPENSSENRGKWLYWSIWAMGLCGFVLILLNANKLGRLSEVNQDKQEALELLEERLTTIQNAESEKAALQAQLFQAQKLEAIGRLAGGIAHDFNNILAAMNGYAEFLADDLKKESPQHGFAQNILKAGAQARDLVDKILAFSRRESTGMQQVDLQEPLSETLSMLKASLSKTINVEQDVDEGTILIDGNATQISQALMNLCVNAQDAMEDEHGTLKLSLKHANDEDYKAYPKQDNIPADNDLPLVNLEEISENHNRLTLGTLVKDQAYASLKVSDTGTGMTRLIMECIFEPFFTTKPVEKGTGLGMAMVHGVVTAHRGVMIINSIVGEGTEFDLLFPIVEQEEKAGIISTGTIDLSDGDGTVLLVEDQDNVREMSENMLQRMGFEVESCSNGLEALEILREHPSHFDVVLTDHNMPEMTGVELIQAMSSENPNIPFVLLTGYSKEKIGDVMKEHSNIKATLKKPVEREALMKTLKGIIAKQSKAA